MGRFGLLKALVLLMAASPLKAQVNVDASFYVDFSTDAFDVCLQTGDRAFEQSLGPDLDDVSRTNLMQFYSWAVQHCASVSLSICDQSADAHGCHLTLSERMAARTRGIAARLPDEIQSESMFAPTVYERLMPMIDEAESFRRTCLARNPTFDDARCRAVAEGEALDFAYQAWRMARREGAVPLVGYAPLRLEGVE